MAEEKKYTLQERVTVTGTGRDGKNFPKGESREVHPRLAERLVKSGIVVKGK